MIKFKSNQSLMFKNQPKLYYVLNLAKKTLLNLEFPNKTGPTIQDKGQNKLVKVTVIGP